MKCLAEREIILSCLAKIKLYPICAAYVFAKAYKYQQTHKLKKKFIQKADENFPRGGTSADLMISLQPGLFYS